MKRLPLVAAVLACVTVAACTPALATAQDAVTVMTAAGHGLKKVHDPRHVTGTIHGRCWYRGHGVLPDPRCTPGSIDPAVTQRDLHSTICRSGYTKTVRPSEPQTERFKYHVAYPAYGLGWKTTELDHLVPLELGGSNDATNLWPEPHPSSYVKDRVENALNAAVCDGRVSLVRAQDAIAADWMTAEHVLRIRP
jgi:hypothetical protein